MPLTHHDDVALTIGDEWLIAGTLLDENDRPLDLAAVDVSWSLIGPDGNQVAGLVDGVTIEKMPEGVVRIVVSDTLTRTLTPARYMDAVRAWVGGEPATQWTGLILANADPFHPETRAPELLLLEVSDA